MSFIDQWNYEVHKAWIEQQEQKREIKRQESVAQQPKQGEPSDV